MVAATITFDRLNQRWRSMPPDARCEAFGSALTSTEQEEAWSALAHREQCRREIELRDLAFDRGETLERPKSSRRRRVPTSGGPRMGAQDDIFRSIPPPVYVEALTGEAVPPGGGMIRCPLPDHDDNRPSCRVYGEPGRGWNCFSCSRGGSAIDLASYLTGIQPRGEGFLELRRHVAERLVGRV